MPISFSVYFPFPSGVDHKLVAFNTGGQDLGFRVSGDSTSITLAPNEKLHYMIVPSGLGFTDTQASGILYGQTTDDEDTGQFFAYLENTTKDTKEFGYPTFTIPKNWENTPFYLYWLKWIPDTTFRSFDKYASGVFSFPHNLQPDNVTISGLLDSDEKTINYWVNYPVLKNEGHSEYSGYTDLPYKVYVRYTYPDNSSPYNIDASGFESGWKYYASGVMDSGIYFQLPFYDQRDSWENIPATYTFRLNYNSAGDVQPGSTPLDVVLNHAFIQNNFFSNLKSLAAAQPVKENLELVQNISIPADVISRRRLAIGIEDIKSVERVFKKNGVYVSNAYNLDFSIYTFSLHVEEFIPTYEGINPYDVVKYYVEFNNGEWYRISPINRDDEMEENTPVPKLFVFDSPPQIQQGTLLKYIEPDGLINNFRIKIVMDLTSLDDSIFVPPEVGKYKCMIFDKQHVSTIEV